MISPEIYKFLSDLRANNNREWFLNNKPVYEKCRQNFIHIIEILINEVSRLDKSVLGLTPKECIFRINRDVRFSSNKEPYKTNFGAFIAPGGRNKGKAGYYLHIEPGSSMIAGGIYMPASPALKAIRHEIYENLDEFKGIVDSPKFLNHYGGISADKLKTKPKGFPADFEGLEYLKFKHYTVMKLKTDLEMKDSGFLKELIDAYSSLYPLNRFLNHAIENA